MNTNIKSLTVYIKKNCTDEDVYELEKIIGETKHIIGIKENVTDEFDEIKDNNRNVVRITIEVDSKGVS